MLDHSFTFPSTGAGYFETAAPANGIPFVDYVYTNARENACYVNASNNAGVRILERCLAVTPSSWTGIPGHSTDGRVLLAAVHNHNLQYCIDKPTASTPAQELSAYLDDRRNKGYSVLDGLGPLTAIGINLTGTTTTITSTPERTQPCLTLTPELISMGASGSTEPPKRFFKYARPFRWTKSVIVAPHLVPVQSKTSPTDGGFPSGSAEAVRKRRFQEMASRTAELGYSRIMSGYHSHLDVMGGARHATGVAAANILANIKANTSAPAFQQAQAQLLAFDGICTVALFKFRLTYGFDQIGAKGVPAVVPKGADVLWETGLPYLTSNQIRVVLKSTAVDSGYPLLDDSEGWGRPNLFDAADVYGRFDGDVNMTLDGSLGGFNVVDSWNNGISGPGLLKKLGSGALWLTGTACGMGPVYADGGNLYLEVPVQVGGLTMLKSAGLVIEMPTAKDGLQAAGSVYLDVRGAGDSIVLVNVMDFTGTFASVTVEGVAGAVSYTSSPVIFTVPGASVSSGVTGTLSSTPSEVISAVAGASSGVTGTASSTSSQAIATGSGARNENGSSYQPATIPFPNCIPDKYATFSLHHARG
ncbi:hypothetical protein HDU80_004646 [Chytriomyces hyalinus]|nr:hypothetical protein HDU80_004646 [Chytriomyces hyalinus]